MTAEDMERRHAELQTYIGRMDRRTYEEELAKTDKPGGVIERVQAGDVLAVACAVREGRAVDAPDANGMTPLHHASAYDMRLTARVLVDRPNAAPWMRDRFGRLPLDIAEEAGHDRMATTIERVTYTSLFRDEQDGPLPPELIERYAARRKELESSDTRPPYARHIEPRGMLPERSDRGHDGRER
jgi:hypothetical protein